MDGDIVYANCEVARPYVIVVGSEKGGTGKSTTAMLLASGLAHMGYAVGTIDFDARQGTLSRYIANRDARIRHSRMRLPAIAHRQVGRHDHAAGAAAAASESAWARGAFLDLADRDVIIADTPGADTHLSRVAHINADTLITPVNDSLLDLDVLARLDPIRREVLGPSVYTQMVWEQDNRRIANGLRAFDWIVIRNRLAHIASRNEREIAGLLKQLSTRIGFHVAPGFGERVVFRELFLDGLTLFDLDDGDMSGAGPRGSSRLAARRELDDLIALIGFTTRDRSQEPSASAVAV